MMLEMRRIRGDERERFHEVVQRYWKELMPRSPVVTDPAMGERYFEDEYRFGEPGSYLWWAVVDGVEIGFANVKVTEDWTGQPWGEIEDFYIGPDWRRRGCGRAFAQHLVNWLKEEGVYRIDLYARSDNPVAVAFWQDVGFTLVLYRLRRYVD